MIELSNSKTRPKLINYKDENRYAAWLHVCNPRSGYIVDILSSTLSYTAS
jgi:hypothetical protein